MKTLALLLATALLSAAVIAGVTVTSKPGDFVLHNTDNSVPAPFDAKSSRFATVEACQAGAATLKAGPYKCDQSTAVTVTATCTDEPAPRIYLPLVDLPDGNGTKGYQLPDMEPPKLKPNSDSEFMPERDWLYVHNPAWPAGYPNCWVRGWEDPTKWRENPVKDPGKVFMELITPENSAENVDLPNDTSYTCWPGDTECVPPA